MIRFALVSPADEVVEIRTYPESSPPIMGDLAEGKSRLVPLVTEGEDYDPIAHVREGPELVVEAERVREVYTIRDKDEAELAAMRAIKKAQLEAEYERRLYSLPGEVEVDGVVRVWHFDRNGVTKVGHMVLMMLAGMAASPQLWKPYEDAQVQVTATGFKQLAGAYAQRDRALFTILQTLKAQLAALNTAAEVDGFDPLAGWD